jgi:DNA-binding Lrp family transcriptional regulator
MSKKKGEIILTDLALNIPQELLKLLEQDYQQTHAQLARQLGITPDQVATILQQLEDDRILVKCQPIINWEKAGLSKVSALIEVKITPQREVGFNAIAGRIYRFPEVRNLSLMSGAYDLAVTVEGPTLREVAHFVSTKLATIDGVVSTTTHFVLKKYKEEGVIIEDEEADRRLLVTP